MAKFSYSAIDRSGKQKSGNIEADSTDGATARLTGMGLMVTSLQQTSTGGSKGKSSAFSFGGSKAKGGALNTRVKGRACNSRQLAIFTRQIATLLQAGLPLLRSLEVMQKQERNPLMARVIAGLVENVKTGNNFSEGLAAYPQTFDRLFVNMVRAGEAGGVLDVVLSRLARFMEKADRLKSKIKAAMIYPLVVLSIAVVIVTGLLVFVVPQFENVFANLPGTQSLPAMTQVLMDLSRVVQTYYIPIIIGFIVLGVIYVLLNRLEGFKRIKDQYALRLPLVGPLAMKATVARFARTFGTLLSSGVPILQALTITRETVNNSVIREALADVHERVRDGESVAAPLERSRVFPTMVTSMIEVGEETAELPEMLNRIADIYDDEVDTAVGGLTSALEPIMIVFLAVVVGYIVIALFLPIIGIMDAIQ